MFRKHTSQSFPGILGPCHLGCSEARVGCYFPHRPPHPYSLQHVSTNMQTRTPHPATALTACPRASLLSLETTSDGRQGDCYCAGKRRERLRSKEPLRDIQPISNREKATFSVTGMTWFLSQSGTAIICNQRERKQGGWGDSDGAGMGS